MMRADAFNKDVYPVRTKTTDLSSYVCSTDEDESNGIIVHETLLQSCSSDEEKSKGIIVQKTLSQSCSTDRDKSKRIIAKQTVPRTRANSVLRRKTNHNSLLRFKDKQIMRLHIICQIILTFLTCFNAEEIF